MNFKTHCEYARGTVDIAPLANVVLLLLIYFLLTSSLVMQPGVAISLPQSDVPTVTSFQTLVVVVKNESLVFFNDRPVPLDKLGEVLQTAAHRTGGHELIIKADKQVPHGVLVQLMNLASKAGLKSVNIATRAEAPATPTAPAPVTVPAPSPK